MAISAIELATLRRYIAEPTQAVYTDIALNELFDQFDGDLSVIAAEVWREKAANSATLVDVTEGPSSRKMSQVYTNAIKQAAYFDEVATGGTPATTRSAKTRAIERI